MTGTEEGSAPETAHEIVMVLFEDIPSHSSSEVFFDEILSWRVQLTTSLNNSEIEWYRWFLACGFICYIVKNIGSGRSPSWEC